MRMTLRRGSFSVMLFALVGCSTMNAPGIRAVWRDNSLRMD